MLNMTGAICYNQKWFAYFYILLKFVRVAEIRLGSVGQISLNWKLLHGVYERKIKFQLLNCNFGSVLVSSIQNRPIELTRVESTCRIKIHKFKGFESNSYYGSFIN